MENQCCPYSDSGVLVVTMGIYYINRLINKGPQGAAAEAPAMGAPGRTLSSAVEAGREVL